MKLLFDAHAFIWWDENPDKLGAHARAACFDIANELLLSAASVWEMQLKVMLSKLRLQKPLPQLISAQLQKNAIRILPLNIDHLLHPDSLPPITKTLLIVC